MNRLPRRTSRIQPPLRGRLAAVLSPEQKQKYSEPVVRKSPSKPRSSKNTRFEASDSQISPVKFNDSLSGSLDLNGNESIKQETPIANGSNELWKLLVLLIVSLILLILISNLL